MDNSAKARAEHVLDNLIWELKNATFRHKHPLGDAPRLQITRRDGTVYDITVVETNRGKFPPDSEVVEEKPIFIPSRYDLPPVDGEFEDVTISEEPAPKRGRKPKE